ncbi:unnamed protein product [Cylicocyclus nassatus]|uniref:Uncharacterized protein n=1 Tax=Cylicocyclus nassatus TaxID=53992 RepID=A0AA36H9C1_CYLNA|nr:unnamed protein product [Cylicocyclus nassatus]
MRTFVEGDGRGIAKAFYDDQNRELQSEAGLGLVPYLIWRSTSTMSSVFAREDTRSLYATLQWDGQRILQCTLPNLKEFVWHNVDMDLLLVSDAHINTMFSKSQYDGYQVESIQFFQEIISIETVFLDFRLLLDIELSIFSSTGSICYYASMTAFTCIYKGKQRQTYRSLCKEQPQY